MFGREFKAAEHRRHIPPTQRVGYGIEPVGSRTADRWLLDDLAEMAGMSQSLGNGWSVLQTNGGGPVLFREFNDYDSGKVSPPDSSGVWNWSVHARLYQVNVGSGAANTAEEAMSMVEQAYAEYKRTASRKTASWDQEYDGTWFGSFQNDVLGWLVPSRDSEFPDTYTVSAEVDRPGDSRVLFTEFNVSLEEGKRMVEEAAAQVTSSRTAAPLDSLIFDSFSELLSSAALLPEEQKSVEDAYEAAELGKWEAAYNLIDWVAGGDHGPRIQKFLETLLDDLSGQGATASRMAAGKCQKCDGMGRETYETDTGSLSTQTCTACGGAGQAKTASRRTAFLDTVELTEPRHRVAGWDWDDHLNGFIAAEAAREFTCACGDNIPAPGYTDCRCGKRWNAYTISANGSKKMIAREVPVRENVVMANRRTAAGTTTCPRCGNKYDGRDSALSRTDNSTYICPSCGGNEATLDFAGVPLVPQTEWASTGRTATRKTAAGWNKSTHPDISDLSDEQLQDFIDNVQESIDAGANVGEIMMNKRDRFEEELRSRGRKATRKTASPATMSDAEIDLEYQKIRRQIDKGDGTNFDRGLELRRELKSRGLPTNLKPPHIMRQEYGDKYDTFVISRKQAADWSDIIEDYLAWCGDYWNPESPNVRDDYVDTTTAGTDPEYAEQVRDVLTKHFKIEPVRKWVWASTYHITQVQQDPSIVKPGDLIATDNSRGRVHKILPPDGMGIMVIMMEDGSRVTLRTSARKIAAPSSGADAIAQHFPGWRVDDDNGNFWEIHSPGGEHAFIHEENGTYTLLMDDNTPDEFYATGLSFEDALAEVRAEGII